MKYQMINEALLLNRTQKIWLNAQLRTLSNIDQELCNQLEQRYMSCLKRKDWEILDQRKKEHLFKLRRSKRIRDQTAHSDT